MRAFLGFIIIAASAACAAAAMIVEDFSSDPLARGWRITGDDSLFRWNTASRNLEVTWDSSRRNSYFHLPLANVLSRSDDFSLGFDVSLHDIAIGASADKPYTFQISVGFLNFSNAMATNFFRGAGQSALGPRNLVEFSYFPDSGFGATFAPTVVTTNNRIFFSDNHPLEMTTGDVFRIHMDFNAASAVLRTVVTRNGAPFAALRDLALSASSDFRVDTLAVMSYSDAIQVGSTQFWGSVLAHGTIDNFIVTLPEHPAGQLRLVMNEEGYSAQFASRSNWQYLLERTIDFTSWTAVSPANNGTGGTISLRDTNAPAERAYYRIRAEKR